MDRKDFPSDLLARMRALLTGPSPEPQPSHWAQAGSGEWETVLGAVTAGNAAWSETGGFPLQTLLGAWVNGLAKSTAEGPPPHLVWSVVDAAQENGLDPFAHPLPKPHQDGQLVSPLNDGTSCLWEALRNWVTQHPEQIPRLVERVGRWVEQGVADQRIAPNAVLRIADRWSGWTGLNALAFGKPGTGKSSIAQGLVDALLRAEQTGAHWEWTRAQPAIPTPEPRSLTTPLTEAVRLGDGAAIRRLLPFESAGSGNAVDPKTGNPKERTAPPAVWMLRSCRPTDPEVTAWVDAASDPEARLAAAVLAGDEAAVASALEAASPNRPQPLYGPKPLTPLAYLLAAEPARPSTRGVVERLLQAGARWDGSGEWPPYLALAHPDLPAADRDRWTADALREFAAEAPTNAASWFHALIEVPPSSLPNGKNRDDLDAWHERTLLAAIQQTKADPVAAVKALRVAIERRAPDAVVWALRRRIPDLSCRSDSVTDGVVQAYLGGVLGVLGGQSTYLFTTQDEPPSPPNTLWRWLMEHAPEWAARFYADGADLDTPDERGVTDRDWGEKHGNPVVRAWLAQIRLEESVAESGNPHAPSRRRRM